MMPFFLLVLFIVQIVGFYFLALLYTKVSKFDDLEKKQRRIMKEMDDSIGAYLSELKDENDRLINRLATMEMKVDKELANEPFEVPPTPVEEEIPQVHIVAPKRPVNLALKSYGEASLFKEDSEEEEDHPDDRVKVLNLHKAGKSVEDIAKELGKGRTEVELILKFEKR